MIQAPLLPIPDRSARVLLEVCFKFCFGAPASWPFDAGTPPELPPLNCCVVKVSNPQAVIRQPFVEMRTIGDLYLADPDQGTRHQANARTSGSGVASFAGGGMWRFVLERLPP